MIQPFINFCDKDNSAIMYVFTYRHGYESTDYLFTININKQLISLQAAESAENISFHTLTGG